MLWSKVSLRDQPFRSKIQRRVQMDWHSTIPGSRQMLRNGRCRSAFLALPSRDAPLCANAFINCYVSDGLVEKEILWITK